MFLSSLTATVVRIVVSFASCADLSPLTNSCPVVAILSPPAPENVMFTDGGHSGTLSESLLKEGRVRKWWTDVKKWTDEVTER